VEALQRLPGIRRLTAMTLPVDRLEVVGHQRKARLAHVANLAASIERIGFLVPLIAIENGGGGHLVIDGQHRLQAA
jgi:ParB-like chromosome segregation protein Spo0J